MAESSGGFRDKVRAMTQRAWDPGKHALDRLQRSWRRPAARGYLIALTSIVLFGMVLRWLHVASVHYSPHSDMISYLAMRDDVFGGLNRRPHALFPPGYSFFQHAFRFLTSEDSLRGYLWLNVLLEAGTMCILARTMRLLGNARIALTATALYAIVDVQILATGLYMSETLTTFLAFAATMFFADVWKRPRWGWPLVWCAVMLAAATQVRTNALVQVGPYGLLLALGTARHPLRRFSPRGIMLGAAILAGTLALCLPWSIRSSRIVGGPAFISTNTGLLFLMSNNPFGDGKYMRLETLPPDVWNPIASLPFEKSDASKMKAGVQYVKDHPWFWMTRTLPQKFTFLFETQPAWNFWPWDDGLGGNPYTHPLGPRSFVPLITSLLLVIPGLIGLFQKPRGIAALAGLLVFANVVPIFLIPAIQRYRYPIDLAFLLAAAILFVKLVENVPWRRVVIVTLAGYVAMAIGVLSWRWMQTASGNLAIGAEDRGALAAMTGTGFFEEFANAGPKAPEVRPIGTLAIDSRAASHLLVSFDFRVETEMDNREPTIDMNLAFKDAAGELVKRAGTKTQLLGPMHPINRYQRKWGHAWRLILVPANAATLELDLQVSLKGIVEIKNLEIHGPISWKNE